MSDKTKHIIYDKKTQAYTKTTIIQKNINKLSLNSF